MKTRDLLLWAFVGIVYLIVLSIMIALFTGPASAHVAHEGTSDGPDPGNTIELYKQPGTDFEGKFMQARLAYTRIAGFRMVHTPERAEVYVYAYTESQCRGEMRKWADYTDSLMITSACHDQLLYNVALHELGHVLDLEHHPCNDMSSVMNKCARIGHITLHDRVSLRSSS